MSRVYFHSPSGEVELHGSERAYLDRLAKQPAMNAYDISDSMMSHDLERASHLMELIPEPPAGEYGANYLHVDWRRAVDEELRWKTANANRPPGPLMQTYVSHDPDPSTRFAKSLRMALEGSFGGAKGRLGNVAIDFGCVALNTALIAGSDEIALAAKIQGWCEVHLWVDGPDRAWLADLMQSGVDKGIYRRTLNGISQGWDEVIEFLRARDDEPVVTSFSITDQFPDGKSWTAALKKLKTKSPWLQLTPKSLRGTTFLLPITAYDLIAPDRETRVELAAAEAGKLVGE